MVLGLETGPLTLIGFCHTTLLNVAENASLIEIKTSIQQKMLNKRDQTCMLHVLTLLIQRMFYNNVCAKTNHDVKSALRKTAGLLNWSIMARIVSVGYNNTVLLFL